MIYPYGNSKGLTGQCNHFQVKFDSKNDYFLKKFLASNIDRKNLIYVDSNVILSIIIRLILVAKNAVLYLRLVEIVSLVPEKSKDAAGNSLLVVIGISLSQLNITRQKSLQNNSGPMLSML